MEIKVSKTPPVVTMYSVNMTLTESEAQQLMIDLREATKSSGLAICIRNALYAQGIRG